MELGKEKSCKFGSFSLLEADFQLQVKPIFYVTNSLIGILNIGGTFINVMFF